MNKMINCKTCGAQIAKSAKSCPHCGAKNKKKHTLATTLFIICLIAIIAALSNNETPQKIENISETSTTVQTTENESENTGKSSSENEEKTAFYVGETAELKDIVVSMVNITESKGSSFNKPSDGNIFVICEFEIANNSSKEINISSMLSFEAYCDDYTCPFSLTALMEKGNKNQLDGSVAAGKKFNGVIGYEVPSDWKELEIHFTPDFWSGKDFTFIAQNN